MIFYSQILRIVLLLVMTSSYEDIEKKTVFHYTTLSCIQKEPVRRHLRRLQNVFTDCDENAAE